MPSGEEVVKDNTATSEIKSETEIVKVPNPDSEDDLSSITEDDMITPHWTPEPGMYVIYPYSASRLRPQRILCMDKHEYTPSAEFVKVKLFGKPIELLNSIRIKYRIAADEVRGFISLCF